MSRYYFNVRDGDNLTIDNEGLEFSSQEGAWLEAARSLAEMTKDAIPRKGYVRHRMAVEVSDSNGPVMAVRVAFATDDSKV